MFISLLQFFVSSFEIIWYDEIVKAVLFCVIRVVHTPHHPLTGVGAHLWAWGGATKINPKAHFSFKFANKCVQNAIPALEKLDWESWFLQKISFASLSDRPRFLKTTLRTLKNIWILQFGVLLWRCSIQQIRLVQY